MNRKIHKIAVPIIWLLIYVFTIPTQLSSYVLCIGEDGHIKIEAATHSQTDTPAEVCEQSTLCFVEAPSSEDHCGSCLDIPIFISTGDEAYVVSTQNLSPTHSVSTVAVLASPQTTSATVSTLNPISNFPPRIPPALGPLRAVILLI